MPLRENPKPLPLLRTQAPARRDRLWLLACLWLHAALGCWGILREPLWFDEMHSLQMVHGSWIEACLHPLADTQPPLYFLLLKLQHELVPGLLPGRLLSLCFGLLCVTAVWLCERNLIRPPRQGRWATLLTALSPQLVYFAQEMRLYSLLPALVAAALAATFALFDERNRLRRTPMLGLGGCAALLAMTNHHGVTFLCAIAAWLALEFQKRRCWREFPGLLRYTGGLCLPVLLAWAILLTRQFGSSSIEWMAPITIRDAVRALGMTAYGIYPDWHLLKLLLTLLLPVPAILAAACVPDYRPAAMLAIFFLLPMAALYLFTNQVKPVWVLGRHSVIFIPPVLLSFALATTILRQKCGPLLRRTANLLLGLLIAGMCLSLFLQHRAVTRSPWREHPMAAIFAAEAQRLEPNRGLPAE